MTVRRSAEPRYRWADEEGGDRLGFATVKDTIDMAIMEAGVECLERTTQVATSPRSEREVLAATRPFTIGTTAKRRASSISARKRALNFAGKSSTWSSSW